MENSWSYGFVDVLNWDAIEIFAMHAHQFTWNVSLSMWAPSNCTFSWTYSRLVSLCALFLTLCAVRCACLCLCLRGVLLIRVDHTVECVYLLMARGRLCMHHKYVSVWESPCVCQCKCMYVTFRIRYVLSVELLLLYALTKHWTPLPHTRSFFLLSWECRFGIR